jgi:hypothetical protein
MFAMLDDTDRFKIHITRNFCPVETGYRIQLHDLPAYTFLVDAPTADDAQRMAFSVARKEGRAKSDAATIQRF